MGYKKGETLRTAFDIYTVEGQRGAGGSGEVYEVRDSEGALYAAKVLDTAKTSASRLKRFKNEIGFCMKNTHKNIIKVIASGITERGATFYVMPLYAGTLRDLISKGIEASSVLSSFGQVLDGVEAAHLQGVWHRDNKPENILFDQKTDILVVADFGIAHFEDEELLTAVETKDNERLANFLYSAPEQRTRGNLVDSKADVYALGLILNEMFTRAVPQGTAFKRVSDVAPGFGYLDGLIELMLRQDPSQRPSIGDVKRELIARGNEFLSLQRLNSLKSEIVPEAEVDDPVIRNPISLVGVDYGEGTLIFELSAPPPPNWIMSFQNPNAQFSSFHGSGPEYFSFQGKYARVGLGPSIPAQRLVDYTKSYIQLANRRYSEIVTGQHRKRLADEKAVLRRKMADEEQRQKILSELKI
jgi:serine/threonine protein kinase